jgi:hypothetical protein
MTDEDNTPDKLELSPTQVVGSALAAVSGAFFASWAGTAGTLIGVAAGSVIATVGAATYTWWLRRTQEAVRRKAAQVRQTTLLTNAMPRTVAAGPLREPGEETTVLPAATDDAEQGEPRSWLRQWDLPWAKVALASVAVMLVALAGITALEAVTGRSVASFTGQADPHGSTLGNAFDNGATSATENDSTNDDQGSDTSTGTPTPTPTPTPTDTATDGTGGDTGSGDTGTTPSEVPVPTPSTDPTELPSADPSATAGTTP